MSPTFTEEELAAMQAVAWGDDVGARPNLQLTLLSLLARHPDLVMEPPRLPWACGEALLRTWELTDAGRALLADLGRLPPHPNHHRPRVVA